MNMKKGVMNLLRQTGRTSRMIEAAYNRARKSERVTIFILSPHQTSWVKAKIAQLDEVNGTMLIGRIKVSVINAAQTEGLSIIAAMVVDQTLPDVFIDHDVIQYYTAPLLKVMHQYDRFLNLDL